MFSITYKFKILLIIGLYITLLLPSIRHMSNMLESYVLKWTHIFPIKYMLTYIVNAVLTYINVMGLTFNAQA